SAMRGIALRMGLAVSALLLAVPQAGAFESDQFLALDIPIADSAAVIDAYVNSEIVEVLDTLSRRRPRIACEAIPPRIYRHLFSNLLSSRFKKFLEESPEVERFPGDDVGYWQYLGSSIYRKPLFPYILPMSSTLDVGGVRLGVDKFGHMMGEGRRYYARYRRALRRGLSEEQAMRKVVLGGLQWEKILLGGLSDGVLSFADLEANYQGLRLARAMCEGPDPHLAKGPRGWHLARPVRFEDYVGPSFDESYNANRYPRGRWKRVRPILLAEHCSKLDLPVVRRRLERYRASDDFSFSRRVLAEHLQHKKLSPNEHSFEKLCREASGREATAGDVVLTVSANGSGALQ
ncbi:MAG: hypothetical protein OEM62_03885, partial [Acidobacteriota bacterium]|nr:hypothetical protein [Acidobacteriota bacterium]